MTGTQGTRVAAGIDFGTTNSAVAVHAGGRVRLVPSATGEASTPSVVAAVAGDRLVGRAAERRSASDPESLVRSVKLALGTSWTREIQGRTYTAVDVAAVILDDLRTNAERQVGAALADVVLTVPAHFGIGQREATVHAARLAGLDVARVVNEPTAAALAYGLARAGSGLATVLVFDLGGGTLDVSLLEIEDGVVEVKATAGDGRLGGRDWDARVARELLSVVREEHGIDLSTDPVAVARIHEAAERAKIELSGGFATEVVVPHLARGGAGELLSLQTTLSRERLLALTDDLLERCRRPIERVLRDAGVAARTVDHAVLVGGAARMPAVADQLGMLTGKHPRREVIADGVAVGAAVQSGVLRGAVRNILLLDVTPMSLGVETEGGSMTRLVPRNTTIPIKLSEMFTTCVDGQPSVRIHVVEGEHEIAAYNTRLGMIELAGLRRVPRGVPRIEVSADVDVNGSATVSATDLDTGRGQTLPITWESIETYRAAPPLPAPRPTVIARRAPDGP